MQQQQRLCGVKSVTVSSVSARMLTKDSCLRSVVWSLFLQQCRVFPVQGVYHGVQWFAIS